MTPNSKYYYIAKAGLQVSSITLGAMMVASIAGLVFIGDRAFIPLIISSAQGLSCISLGVMSYHLGKK